jgi:hypothetical protein
MMLIYFPTGEWVRVPVFSPMDGFINCGLLLAALFVELGLPVCIYCEFTVKKMNRRFDRF